MKTTQVLCKILLLFVFTVGALQAQEIDFEQKKVLLVYGGWPGHTPEIFAKRMNSWLEAHNAKVILAEDTSIYADETVMAEVDLIIQSITMSNIKMNEAKGLLNAVKNGVGIAGCHGGMGDSFRNNTEYQYMIGGQFVNHPGGQIAHSVQITQPDDPIVNGIEDFSLTTEQYYMHVDPNVNVLATTTFSKEHDDWIENAVMPVAWKKTHGKGRVFYLSLGHSDEVFDVAPVWEILTRGIFWASKSKYEASEAWMHPVY